MKTILCYGDSNTYGYDPETGLRYPEEVRWAGQLRKRLGEEYRVIEEGCNGRTTIYRDPVEGWKNGMDYLKPCLNSHKPIDLVILMLGSNDLKKMYGATAAESARGAGQLVDVIQAFTQEKQGFTSDILLISPPKIGEGIASSSFSSSFAESAVEKSRQFAEHFQKIAGEKQCHFFDAAAVAPPSKTDCLHLSPESHGALAEALYQEVCRITR